MLSCPRPIIRIAHVFAAVLCGIALTSVRAGAQPHIQVTHPSYTESITAGDSLVRTLTIENTGSDSLHYSILVTDSTLIDSLSRPAFRPAPFKFAATGKVGSTAGSRVHQAPAGYRATPSTMESMPNRAMLQGARVLLVQDYLPWGLPSNQQVLAANGISYDIIPSSQLATTTLSNYSMMIVASDQPQGTYNMLASRMGQIEQFVYYGGTLEFHAASFGYNGGNSAVLILPGGTSIVPSFYGDNFVDLPGHPIVQGVPNPFTGSSASHASFANIPFGAALITHDPGGAPTLIEYTHGRGLVIASGHTLEYGYANAQAAGQILANMIPYALATRAWLKPSILAGTVAPGGHDDVSLLMDAHRLTGGVYALQLAIDSDDSSQPRVVVPVELTVIGIPDIVVAPVVWDFGPRMLLSTDSVRVWVYNFGSDALTGTAGLSVANPGLTSDSLHFSLQPGDSAVAVVRFTPQQLGPVAATLTVESNDPDTPSILVSLNGTGVPAPDISVSPDSLLAGLTVGDSLQRTVTISNDGAADLTFQVALEGALTESAQGRSAARPRITRITTHPPGVAPHEDERADAASRSDAQAAAERGRPPLLGKAPARPGPRTDAQFHFLDGFEDGNYDGWQIGISQVDVTNSTAARGAFSLHQLGAGGHYNGASRLFDSEHPTNISFYVRTATNFNYTGYVVLTDSLGGVPIYFYATGAGVFACNNTSYAYEANIWYHVEFRNIDYLAQTFDYVINDALVASQVPLNYVPYVPNVARIDLYNFDTGMAAWWDHIELSSGGPVDWLAASPASGVVPAGGSAEITVTFDATDLLGGAYDASLAISSNDPDEALVAIPVHLQVTGVPDARLEGAERRVASKQNYQTNSAVTIHSFPIPQPFVGGGELDLKVEGDYGYITEIATLVVEGDTIGSSKPTINDCLTQISTFPISPATMALWAADGVLNAEVFNTFDVDLFCATNAHTVTLRVRAPADTVRTAPVFLGNCSGETLRVTNVGTDVLHITGVGTDNPSFAVSAGPTDLLPGTALPVIVTFCPTVLGPASATLTITSDDPDAGVITAVVEGLALDPPVMEVSPDSLDAALLSGEATTLPLTIRNVGASDLIFGTRVELAAAPQARPATGMVSRAAPLRSVWAAPELPPGGRRVVGSARAEFPRLLDVLPLALSDPLGDAVQGPDLIEVRGLARDSLLHVELVVSGTLNPNDFGGVFSIDADQNPATGVLPSYAIPGQDARIEYEVGLFNVASGYVDLYGVSLGYLGSFPVQISANSLRFALPLALLGPDEGNVDFSGVIGGLQGPGDWYPDIGHGTLRRFNWLSVVPSQGTVAPGDSQVVDVHFDAGDLLGGDYLANVLVDSNDPLAATDTVPAHLHVTGVPRIAVQPTEVAFGVHFVGVTTARKVGVRNSGTDQLNVTTSMNGGSEFVSPPAAFSLAPGESTTVEVSFTPTVPALASGFLYINSNDPIQPAIEVALSGEGVLPPDIAVAPDSILAGLYSGEVHTRTVHIENTGASNLYYQIEVEGVAGPSDPDSMPRLMISSASRSAARGIAQLAALPWNSDALAANRAAAVSTTVDPNPGLRTATRPESHPGPDAQRLARMSMPERFLLAGGGLFDGFEDGNADDWAISFGASAEVTNTTAGHGTYSLRVNTGGGGHFSGASRGFGPAQASRVEFDVRLPDTFHNSGYVVLLDSLGRDAIFFFAQANGAFYLNDPTAGDASFAYAANTWYHVEFRNIDYVSGRFDYYIDGVLLKAGVPMRYPAANLSAIHLYNYDSGAHAWWDDVEVSVVPRADWLSAAPDSGLVPAGGSADITVTLDATGLFGGSYAANLKITSNDPDEVDVLVPVQLEVTGAPNLTLGQKAGDFTSTQPYGNIYNAITFHDFVVPAGAQSVGAHFDLTIDGDFGDLGEAALLMVEGDLVGNSGNTPGDCATNTFGFNVTAAKFNAWAADGVIHATVQNSPSVDPFCTLNRHTVHLRYNVAADSVDFGQVFFGACRTETLVVANNGTDVLDISSLGVSGGPFTVSDSSLTLAPGASSEILLQFCPPALSPFTGDLTLFSNDPDLPTLVVALLGEGVLPPVIAVTPDSILAGLFSGDSVTRVVHIENTGGSELHYQIDTQGVDLLTADPAASRATARVAPPVREPETGGTDGGIWRPAGLSASALTAGMVRPGSSTGVRPDPGPLGLNPGGTMPRVGSARARGGASLASNGFVDGFEDGNANGWAIQPASSAQVTNATAAHGNYSLRLDALYSTLFGGASRSFAGVQPTHVEFNVRLPDTYHNAGYFVLADSVGTDAIFFLAQSNGFFYVNDPSSGDASFAYAPNTWYHVEFRNIEYATRTFDYYVDGVLRKAGIPMRYWSNSGTANAVHLFNFDYGSTAWWDDVHVGTAAASWLSVAPTSGVVPAGGSADVAVKLDATGLPGGAYGAQLTISSDDPLQPEVLVPVHLDVTGVPDVALAAKAGDFVSTQSYSTYNATTNHDFGLPGGGHALGATFDLTLDGDYGAPYQWAQLVVEGLVVGVTGQTPNCGARTFSFDVTPASFDVLALDGVVHAMVMNNPNVSPYCTRNLHTVRMRYYDTADTLDFGALFVGACTGESLKVSNTGTDVLHITSISVSAGPFSVGDSLLTLLPGESREVAVYFCPSAEGLATGQLTVVSDDPDEGALVVELRGVGIPPPVLDVTPASLSASLLTGGTEDQVLHIKNTGGSELAVTLQVVPGSLPASARRRTFALSEGVSRGATLSSTGTGRGIPVIRGDSTQPDLPIVLNDAIGDGGAVDVVAIRASGQGDTLRMQIDFAGGVNFYNFNGLVSFDIDQNPLTGTASGTGIAGHDAGVEYEALFYNVGGYQRIELYSTGPYIYLGSFPAAVGISQLRFSIPLAMLGGDDGRCDFVGAVGTSQGITDWFPEAGHGSVVELGWLALDAYDLTLQPGAQFDVNVHFDAAGLDDGDYHAAIQARSNDPLHALLEVPAQLHVTGAADIAVRPDSVVFPDVVLGSAFSTPVWISNRGTAPLSGTYVATTLGGGTVFGPTVAMPFVLAPHESIGVDVTFQPAATGLASGTLAVSSDDADEPLVTVPLQGEGFAGPHIVLTPDQLDVSVMIGTSRTVPIEIGNTGDRPLYWSATTLISGPAAIEATAEPVVSATGIVPKSATAGMTSSRPSGPLVSLAPKRDASAIPGRAGPLRRQLPASVAPRPTIMLSLEDVRTRLDAQAPLITAAIPNRFDFGEGDTGYYIVDGGADMYDTGNMIATNLGNPINYSNDGVSSSTLLGPQGRYLTRKYPGLFVFAADLDSVDEVYTYGDLGADGGGYLDASILSLTVNGHSFKGFVKRVYGATDPSVNHLFIVEDAPSLSQSYPENSNEDFHLIEGLSQSRRLYLLVYARTGGGYIDNVATLEIMRRFLEAAEPSWISASPDSGVVMPGSSSTMNVTLDATGLEIGDHQGALHLLSNDPVQSDFEVTVMLHADTTTAVALSLVEARADPSAAHLVWHVAGGEQVSATLYRREGAGGWDALGMIASDGEGFLRFDDTRVVAGHRYGYRLGFAGDTEEFSPEVLIDVPNTMAFALHGPQPNPSTSDLRVSFTLPDQSPASLEVLDLAGRRVAYRDVGALGVGRHTVALGEGRPVPAGVYMIRLTRGTDTQTRKAVVMQ